MKSETQERTQFEVKKAIRLQGRAKKRRKVKEGNPLTQIQEKFSGMEIEAKKNFLNKTLTDKQRTGLIALLGLDGNKPMSQGEAARATGIPLHSFSPMEKAVLKKLKYSINPEPKPKKVREPLYAPFFTDKTKAIEHLSKLDEEGQLIAAHRLGLNGEKPMYQREVAELIGKSNVYVSNKERAMFEELKAISEKEAEPITLFDAKSAA